MARVLANVFGALVISSIAIVLAVSFASIVYTGPLDPFLARGIGTTLLAASIAMFLGAFLFSYRGTVITAQDLTAILLAGAALSIAAQMDPSQPEALFATVLVTLAVAAACTGLAMLALGYFGLGNIIRFIPYPVMGGFLAATGYLLIMGAIGTLLGEPLELSNLGVAFEGTRVLLWAPWMAASILVLVAVRLIPGKTVLPVAIGCLGIAFYVFLFVAGIDLDTASARGWLLGPFPSGGFLSDIRLDAFSDVDWSMVSGQFLTFAAVVVMAVVGAGLNLSGVELEVGKPLDADRDFRAVGLSSLLAAPTGGLIGYPGFASTVLAHRLGGRGMFVGLTVALGYLVTAFGGAGVLEVFPKGLFAATIGFLGFDLLYNWVWNARKRLVRSDYAVILVILVTSMILGFLEALAVGLVGSVLIFVVSYSRQNFLRARSDLGLRTSTSERGLTDIETLKRHGERVGIFEFNGYLFFGTAMRLKTQIENAIGPGATRLEAVILDFTRVQGIDPSAAQSLNQIAALCSQRGIRAVFSGMSEATLLKFRRFSGRSEAGGPEIHPTLDSALQAEEERLLATYSTADSGSALSFAEVLKQENPDFDFDAHFEAVDLPEGQYLFHADDPHADMYLVISGSVQVTVPTPQNAEIPVARLLEGALIGEIAFFGEERRSAGILADTDARLYKISKERLQGLQRSDPDFAVSFMGLAARHMARRLDRANKQFTAALDQGPAG